MDTRKLYFSSGIGEQHHVVDEGTGKTVSLTYSDEGGDVAEEIARRWNAFPELVEALDNIHTWAVNTNGQDHEERLQNIADIVNETFKNLNT